MYSPKQDNLASYVCTKYSKYMGPKLHCSQTDIYKQGIINALRFTGICSMRKLCILNKCNTLPRFLIWLWLLLRSSQN